MQIAILVFLAVTTALVLIGRTRSDKQASEATGVIGVDLPCPWCNAATAETDTACPACGQAFGE